MKPTILCGAILCSWALFAAPGHAQFGQPAGFGQGVGRPGISPYLNLLRNGDPAINYYGLVRPQIAAAQTFQQLGSAVVGLEANAGAGNSNQPVQTGIAASFMTHRTYFMNNGSNGAAGAYGQYRPSSITGMMQGRGMSSGITGAPAGRR